jgi:hypothetical protein
MSLLDLIEMLMDWKSTSERHPGEMNIACSIDVSVNSFPEVNIWNAFY